MSNLIEYAKKELRLAGLFDSDSDYEGSIGDTVLELITVFAEQNHSGFSARLVSELFTKLSRFEPLTPIRDVPEDWISIYGDDTVLQNKRCSSVFKESNGLAYDINGIIFQDSNGELYTKNASVKYITFPYVPKTEIVKDEINKKENTNE